MVKNSSKAFFDSLHGNLISVIIVGFDSQVFRNFITLSIKSIHRRNAIHFVANFLELILRNTCGYSESYDATCWRTHDTFDWNSFFLLLFTILKIFKRVNYFLFSNRLIGSNISKPFCSSTLECQMEMLKEIDFVSLEFWLLVRECSFISILLGGYFCIVTDLIKAFKLSDSVFFVINFQSFSKEFILIAFLIFNFKHNFKQFHILILRYPVVKNFSIIIYR